MKNYDVQGKISNKRFQNLHMMQHLEQQARTSGIMVGAGQINHLNQTKKLKNKKINN